MVGFDSLGSNFFYKILLGDCFNTKACMFVCHKHVPADAWIKRLDDGLNAVYGSRFFSEEEMIKTGRLGKEPGNFKNYLRNKKRPRYSLTSLMRSFFDGYDILSSLLSGKPVKQELLISAANRKFMEAQKKNWNITELVLKSILLIKLMNYLEDEKMIDDIDELLDTPGKKSAFYEGVLVGHLMSVQYGRLKNTPFEKKLYGLNMNVERVKKRYSEVIAKLRQYDKAYPELEAKASENMMQAEKEGWHLKPEEVAYYFTLGYTLHAKYYKKKEDEKDE